MWFCGYSYSFTFLFHSFFFWRLLVRRWRWLELLPILLWGRRSRIRGRGGHRIIEVHSCELVLAGPRARRCSRLKPSPKAGTASRDIFSHSQGCLSLFSLSTRLGAGLASKQRLLVFLSFPTALYKVKKRCKWRETNRNRFIIS